jgi:DNA-directed RNA polymerase specialized sigma24 family protein
MADETAMSGAGGRFPATRQSLVIAIRSASPEERRQSFDALVVSYWKPVYRYLRLRWRISNDDAMDLTQGFFMHAFEKSTLERFEPARARFRTWLRVCLDGYVANQHKAASRVKRGGGVEFLDLDFAAVESELGTGIAEGTDPEAWFRREWVRDLFERSLADLRAECDALGKQTALAVFERYDLNESPGEDAPTYSAMAVEFGVAATQITNYLAWARREFRRLVLARLREATGSEEEFRAEAREVLGVAPL